MTSCSREEVSLRFERATEKTTHHSPLRLRNYTTSPPRKLERTQRLRRLLLVRRDGADDGHARLARESGLKVASEFRVAVGDVNGRGRGSRLGKLANDGGEGEEAVERKDQNELGKRDWEKAGRDSRLVNELALLTALFLSSGSL